MIISKLKAHIRFLIPSVLVALLVLDGLVGYVAPDPLAGIQPVTQTAAAAAEPPVLEIQEVEEERAVPQGTAEKLGKVDDNVKYKDGSFTGSAKGFGGTITVKVVIKDGKIKSIKILSAAGETKAYLDKASVLTGRIIKKQSTNVDAVSGATYSSNGIIKAVRNALKKAVKKKEKKETKKTKKKKKKKKKKDTNETSEDKKKPEEPEIITEGNWKDGIYTGEGEGFGGKLHVLVTIEGGKITDLQLIDSKDDENFMGKARPAIFGSVIETQGTDIDAVTGATYSSYGLLQAINDALSKAAADGDGSGDIVESGDNIGSGDDGGSGDNNGPEDGGGSEAVQGDDAEKTYNDGTYTVTCACIREGVFDYDIVVTLTIEGGMLSQLSVSKGEDYTEDEGVHEDNDYYLNLAANGPDGTSGMIARILSAQSAETDAVTGATFSSNAIKGAVAGILAENEAGRDIEMNEDS